MSKYCFQVKLCLYKEVKLLCYAVLKNLKPELRKDVMNVIFLTVQFFLRIFLEENSEKSHLSFAKSICQPFHNALQWCPKASWKILHIRKFRILSQFEQSRVLIKKKGRGIEEELAQ